MADFRFACTHCGQRISCDSELRGREITCPACQTALTVPAPSPKPPPPHTSTRMPGERAKISGFAVASLVSSALLSIGCIPGIVCGHIALKRIRRNPSLLGKRLAIAGLLISYLSLAGTILVIGLKLSANIGITTVVRTESDEAKLMLARGIDQVLIGDPESETAHAIQTVNSESGLFFGRHWRATPGTGRFSYTLKVLPNTPMTLNCRYWGSDTGGREFDVLINERLLATQILDRNVPDQFFDVEYRIPRNLTRGQTAVSVEFRAHAGKSAGGIFACEMLKP